MPDARPEPVPQSSFGTAKTAKKKAKPIVTAYPVCNDYRSCLNDTFVFQ